MVGQRLGPYEVVSTLGAGGMGEVYRATDTHLKRQVAIKVLPASVAGDADRLARFQREAEVLAALNHPNIAAIYGLEKTADFTALVMELVAFRTADGSRATDLWMWDLAAGIPSRLTSSGDANFPVVAPNGKSLTISAWGSGRAYTMSLAGGGTPAPMADGEFEPASWSRDGKWMAFLHGVNGVTLQQVRAALAPARYPMETGKGD